MEMRAGKNYDGTVQYFRRRLQALRKRGQRLFLLKSSVFHHQRGFANWRVMCSDALPWEGFVDSPILPPIGRRGHPPERIMWFAAMHKYLEGLAARQ